MGCACGSLQIGQAKLNQGQERAAVYMYTYIPSLLSLSSTPT